MSLAKKIKNLLTPIRSFLDNRERSARYEQILSLSKVTADPESPRLYVVVQKSVLTDIQCGIQAAHAVAEFVNDRRSNTTKDWVKNHKTIILLSATALQMGMLHNELHNRKLAHKGFNEPDLANIMTAIAIQPMTRDRFASIFGYIGLKRA